MMMIIYRIVSFLICFLSSMIIGASFGFGLGVLIGQSAFSLLWFFSCGEIVLMIGGAIIGGGLGLYAACVIDAELRAC